MTKPLGEIGIIGHVDHGKTTLSAALAIASTISATKNNVIVIGAQDEQEEFRGISPTAPPSFVIKNYHAPMQTIQPTGRQKRNQRRKKTKKNARNRK